MINTKPTDIENLKYSKPVHQMMETVSRSLNSENVYEVEAWGAWLELISEAHEMRARSSEIIARCESAESIDVVSKVHSLKVKISAVKTQLQSLENRLELAEKDAIAVLLESERFDRSRRWSFDIFRLVVVPDIMHEVQSLTKTAIAWLINEADSEEVRGIAEDDDHAFSAIPNHEKVEVFRKLITRIAMDIDQLGVKARVMLRRIIGERDVAREVAKCKETSDHLRALAVLTLAMD